MEKENRWMEIVKKSMNKPELKRLVGDIKNRRQFANVYPKGDEVFNAFKLCPYEKTKIVIVGIEPHNKADVAHGLAFSTLQEQTPPSIENIFKEIHQDLYSYFSYEEFRQYVCKSNNLTSWAKDGVLLMNTILTVEEGNPLSHKNYGWNVFTEAIFQHLNDFDEPLVFMFWGKEAQEYKQYIKNAKHLILEAGHPSPLNSKNDFLGCKHFSQAIEFLGRNNRLEYVNKEEDMGFYVDYKQLVSDFKAQLKNYPIPNLDKEIDITEEGFKIKCPYIIEFSHSLTFKT